MRQSLALVDMFACHAQLHKPRTFFYYKNEETVNRKINADPSQQPLPPSEHLHFS